MDDSDNVKLFSNVEPQKWSCSPCSAAHTDKISSINHSLAPNCSVQPMSCQKKLPRQRCSGCQWKRKVLYWQTKHKQLLLLSWSQRSLHPSWIPSVQQAPPRRPRSAAELRGTCDWVASKSTVPCLTWVSHCQWRTGWRGQMRGDTSASPSLRFQGTWLQVPA